MSASNMVENGPERTRVRSITRMPVRGWTFTEPESCSIGLVVEVARCEGHSSERRLFQTLVDRVWSAQGWTRTGVFEWRWRDKPLWLPQYLVRSGCDHRPDDPLRGTRRPPNPTCIEVKSHACAVQGWGADTVSRLDDGLKIPGGPWLNRSNAARLRHVRNPRCRPGPPDPIGAARRLERPAEATLPDLRKRWRRREDETSDQSLEILRGGGSVKLHATACNPFRS